MRRQVAVSPITTRQDVHRKAIEVYCPVPPDETLAAVGIKAQTVKIQCQIEVRGQVQGRWGFTTVIQNKQSLNDFYR